MTQFLRTRANALIWEPDTAEDRERGVALLHAAFCKGDRSAGYDLATLSQSLVPDAYKLSDDIRAELVLEQADQGDDMAALELAHVFLSFVTRDRLRAILVGAAARGSQEAKELIACLDVE
jgi:hypothetical protein